MEGDDAVRHCGQCKKKVYQLSIMSSSQIEELLASQADVCGRFFQRADGTVMTSDCSIGSRRRRRRNLVLGVSAGALSVLGLGLADSAPPPMSEAQVHGHVVSSSMPAAEVPNFPDVQEFPDFEDNGAHIMGRIAYDPRDISGDPFDDSDD